MAKSVYLDYNATTPLAPEVLEAISATLRDAWGNPSSSHHAGQKARRCIVEARGAVARMIHVKPEDMGINDNIAPPRWFTFSCPDIIFTSGGTESNNMVFDSTSRYFFDHVRSESNGGRSAGGEGGRPHVVITNLEHDSVSLTVQKMEEQRKIEATVVKADPSTGKVSPQDILAAIRPSTVLVSVMLANNETGIIQPVEEIVKAVRRYENDCGKKQRIYVHTDAAQALGKIPVDATELGVDYLTIVGHKFYGPRVGALFVSGLELRETPLYPMLYGGGQERSFRPGTENTGMIAGLGKAAELVADHIEEYRHHFTSVRDYLEEQLLVHFADQVHFNGKFDSSPRIPNTCNVSLIGPVLRGNQVVSALEHCQASVGAACHSHTVSRPSPILLAVGIPEAIAVNALRLSVGRETTKEDIDTFIEDLKSTVAKLMSTSQQ